MTVDEIIDSCAESSADDWAFWVYLCGLSGAPERPRRGAAAAAADDLGSCARAVYLKRDSIGLSWSPASDDEIAPLAALDRGADGGERIYHWVELLYEGAVVDRCLAVRVDDLNTSLPVPSVDEVGDKGTETHCVSRRAHRLVRLANAVDPDSADFDGCFAGLGLEVR